MIKSSSKEISTQLNSHIVKVMLQHDEAVYKDSATVSQPIKVQPYPVSNFVAFPRIDWNVLKLAFPGT